MLLINACVLARLNYVNSYPVTALKYGTAVSRNQTIYPSETLIILVVDFGTQVFRRCA
jgi:hypothetical protein